MLSALSHSSIDRYNLTIDRLGDDFVQLISRSYRRACGNNCMNTDVFFHSVLAEEYIEMPFTLKMQLFHAFNIEKTGIITLKEFLTTMAVLINGTYSEKLRFIFQIMNVSQNNLLSKQELYDFLHIFTDPKDLIAAKDEVGSSWTVEKFAKHILSFSRGNEYLSLEDLNQAIARFKEVCFLKFISSFGDRFLQLSDSNTIPTLDESLITKKKRFCTLEKRQLFTPFILGKEDFVKFRMSFFAIHEKYYQVGITLDKFLETFSLFFPSETLRKLFVILDSENKELISLNAMLVGLCSLCKSSLVELEQFCFDLFDADETGLLSIDQFIPFLLYIYPLLPYQTSTGFTTENIQIAKSYGKQAFSFISSAKSISFQSYMKWIKETILSTRFLQYISCIVQVGLGTTSLTRDEERHFIASIYQEYNIDMPGRNGDLLYLIPCAWWNQWLDYVQLPKKEMCSSCRRLYISTSTSSNSDDKKSLNPPSNTNFTSTIMSLPDLDVSNLLLSSESSQLKPNLVYGVDYLVVQYELWFTLGHWYKKANNKEIKRYLIQYGQRIELDLYPLHLKVFILDGRIKSKKQCDVDEKTKRIESIEQIDEIEQDLFNLKEQINEIELINPKEQKNPPELVGQQEQINQKEQINQIEEVNARVQLDQPKIIATKEQNDQSEVEEIYLQEFSFSKVTELSRVKQVILKQYENRIEIISLERTQLWRRSSCTNNKNWNFIEEDLNTNKSLLSAYVENGDDVLLQISDKDGKWKLQAPISTCPSCTLSCNCSFCSSSLGSVPGVLGLYNLGNTCYLNSAIQCLSHLPLLTEYFLEKEYLYDINLANPLGMNGFIAIAYGDLIEEMFKKDRNYHSLAPKSFKQMIERLNPQFEGLQQQDAQELLSVVISGLNEDLSRSSLKPYLAQPDSNHRPDSIVANEWWRNHIDRDPSIITALLCGQFKSLLHCLECDFESARFEPFSILQLPLPELKERETSIVVYLYKSSCCPYKLRIPLQGDCTVKDLIEKIIAIPSLKDKEGWASLSLTSSVVAVIKEKKIACLLDLDTHLDYIHEDESLVLYQVEEFPEYYHKEKFKGIQRSLQENDIVLVRYRKNYRFLLAKIIHVVTAMTKNQEQEEHYKIGDGIEEETLATTRYVDVTYCKPLHHLNAVSQYAERLSCQYDILESDAIVPVHIYLIHRRLELVPFYFANPFRLQFFGLPFVLRVLSRKITGDELYKLVSTQMEWCLDLEDNRENLNSKNNNSCYFSMNPSSGFSYDFRLCFVNRKGSSCSQCSWFSKCKGCLLFPNEQIVNLQEEETIAIDWGEGMLLSFNQEMNSFSQLNFSIENKFERKKKIDTIQDCMEIFSKEEQVIAYCSNCTRKHSKQTETKQLKSLKIWGLPPILVIQLKRFKFTRGRDIKLENRVEFPKENLDLKDFLARSLHEDLQEQITKEFDEKFHFPKFTLSRTETCYDLYGVVNHSGGLGAGHYTSFVKQGEHWIVYDDCSFSLYDKHKIGESNLAYLLFYVRKDMKNEKLHEILPRMPKSVPLDVTVLRQKMEQWKQEQRNQLQGTLWKYLPGKYTSDTCSVM